MAPNWMGARWLLMRPGLRKNAKAEAEEIEVAVEVVETEGVAVATAGNFFLSTVFKGER